VARRLTVDTSVVRARQALRLVKKDTLEWGTPALYLCAPDGRVFESTTASSPRSDHSHEETIASHQEVDAPEVEALYNEALSASWSERWDQSAALLQQVPTRHPHHAEAAAKLEQARYQQRLSSQYRTGLRLLDTGEWEQAADTLGRLDPDYRDTAALLARA